MYHVEGNAEQARRALESTLDASAARGYFRIFLDEQDLLRPLLKTIEPRLKDQPFAAFAMRLLEAMSSEPVQAKPKAAAQEILSDRELEVLSRLAAGESYKEIAQNLFLSLNTVQFHVKSIYGKLQVNKRTQAIEKARALNLL